ncbi:MAG TPA: hydantoinase/oxoprolinase family protein, partial [Chromatiaceae bacterium]|nr:hydantoinase/oxoprolinase family protein [Chromatiaceae bacterium]
MWLGVDTGGTFTDFVLFDGQSLRVHKVLSTPDAPERAIIQGIHALGIHDVELSLMHGSTVATNAVLEGKGARTVFVTNRGLGDVLTLGRQARSELYNLQPEVKPPPVPAPLCLETGGRIGADGELVDPLSDDDLTALATAIDKLRPEAVAVCLLFSFLDDQYEQRIRDALPQGMFVSLSSEVLPVYREYERGIATWLNAWVGPLVHTYLQRLQAELPTASISVMQSSGGTMDVASAGHSAVNMLLSGPAGGLNGARHVAAASDISQLITFDMGGTSTDVALIDGAIELSGEGYVAGYPVSVPMVDLHTIGAGGGSIARVDAGGLLKVGPESAAASPGPACYGGGGPATVTDANLILGRLCETEFLGGTMQLDRASAEQRLSELARQLDCNLQEVAAGIIDIANEHMSQALRVISVERGIDPADFTLVSFGGAGGLHVCALAESLLMSKAMVPVGGGVLSALGMLAAPRSRQITRSIGQRLDELSDQQITLRAAALSAQGSHDLQGEGVSKDELSSELFLDLRYLGQSHALTVPWSSIAQVTEQFHRQHEQRYGHRLELAVELVSLRASVSGPQPELSLSGVLSEIAKTSGAQRQVKEDARVRLLQRS